jgi:hypothetical protein
MVRFGVYGLLSVQCLLNRMRASFNDPHPDSESTHGRNKGLARFWRLKEDVPKPFTGKPPTRAGRFKEVATSRREGDSQWFALSPVAVVTRVRLQGADRPSGGRRRIVNFDPATTLEVRNGWAFLHAPWIEVVTFEVA